MGFLEQMTEQELNEFAASVHANNPAVELVIEAPDELDAQHGENTEQEMLDAYYE